MNTARVALLAAGVVVGCVAAAFGQPPEPSAKAWKPVKGGLMTRWAKDVKAEAPLPEYPRPTMVREKWQNLNGVWQYQITRVRGSKDEDHAPLGGNVLVPFPLESALSGVGHHLAFGERVEYRRTFEVPADWAGSNILLHFGAVNWETMVRVNGTVVATHEGGYDPITCDITKAVKAGANTVTLEVRNPGNTGGQPRGKQFDKSHAIWYTASSGIWQTVWMEPVRAEHIRGVDVLADWKTGEVSFDIHQNGGKSSLLRPVSVEILDGDKVVASGEQRVPGPVRCKVPSPSLWSPDSPHLYTYRAKMESPGGGALDNAGTPPVAAQPSELLKFDTVSGYFAFRGVELGKDDRGMTRLLLNGKPIFHYGPLDQGFWPDGLYTAPTDEALKSDIIAAKRMGCNMIRKHVKVEPERWYYWCDKLGVMVWQDMPSPFFKTKDFDEGFPEINDKWKANFEKELKAVIEARRNHPSIVMWVPWNEGWGQQDIDWSRSVAEGVKKMDPTRLVNNATGWTDMGVGDTRDVHNYPEPAMVPIEKDEKGQLWGGRAAVLGEFGGLGLPLEGHTWVNKDNWGYRTYKTKDEVTDAYIAMMEQMPALIAQGLSAAVYTQTTDVEIECNGWLTYDREVWKIDPEKAKAATMPMYGKPPQIKVLLAHATEGPVEARQNWSYTTTFPDLDWYRQDFRPGSWPVGKAGFGTDKTPGALIGTWWNASDIWMRTAFRLAAPPKNAYLKIHHDEDTEVYINGELAATLKGYTTSYQLVKISKEAAAKMKAGEVAVAIHCHQTKGGQYIDCGIVDIVPGE